MSQLIRIKVTDAVGSGICVSSEDGGKVFEKLNVATQTDRPIELDFSGVEIVISAFLNAAIGRLVQNATKEEIAGRITFSHIEPEDRELIDQVLENAERFYADPGQFRRALELEEDDEK